MPLAGAILLLIHVSPLRDTAAYRYVSHPVECVEVAMFCAALGAFFAKLMDQRGERKACQTEILPAWDGRVVPVADAATLLGKLRELPGWLRRSLMVKRAEEVLAFVRSRGSANDLDDHLRALADNDAVALDASYALTRFITWAMPILGFLGTVLGITGAISGVTPEVLEKSLSTVTDGLALAFDTTALALGLTMITMFVSFVIERTEQATLEMVDRFADRELAHRFERSSTESAEVVMVVRQSTEVLAQATRQLVEQQVVLWSRAWQASEERHGAAEARQQERFTAALAAALDQTLETHERRLSELDEQGAERSSALLERLALLAKMVQDTGLAHQQTLGEIATRLAAALEALTQLQAGERQLVHLQEALERNLNLLAGAGAFEQAVHSLTAAIHLLTARSAAANRLGPPRSGAAA